MMNPLPPESVFYTIQSGFPADGIFLAAVGAMNSLKNQSISIEGISPADPEFVRALELLRKIQLSGAVGMRVRQDASKQQTSVVTFRSKDISEQTLADIREFRQLLHLDQDAQEFKLAYGPTSASGTELAMQTRSLFQIMAIFSGHVEVPTDDVAQGRAVPGIDEAKADQRLLLARIHSSKTKPADAYVAAPYRGHWFWIDDRDLRTKRAFSFMMLLFTLSDPGGSENLPLITIPAQ
jgi:hypothetical protein